MQMPESLQQKLELFRGRGRLFRREDDLFSQTSWVAVLLGQGLWPEEYDQLVDSLPDGELENLMQQMRDTIGKAVRGLPTQADYIARHCAAAASAITASGAASGAAA
jgi:tryptophan halogenase